MLLGRDSLSPARFAIVSMLIALVLIVGACFLPQSRYIRFTSSPEPELHKVGWVYQRIHFDPTPIDVVFIGSSHTIYGIDDEQVETIASKVAGATVHVSNFAILHPGRDMDYLIAREALENAHPRLLVIEVQDDEPRAMHVAFYRFGDVRDILDAPILVNTEYLSNLVRLPARQISLFLQSLAPRLFGDSRNFDVAQYRGTHWRDTMAELDEETPLTTVLSKADLEQELEHFHEFLESKTYLPAPLRSWEYRASFIYLDKIIALAREKNVPVRFLYLPRWQSPPQPEFAAHYRSYAPIWIAPGIFDRTDVWHDVNHLNRNGSRALSQWVGQKIGERWLKGGDRSLEESSLRP